MNAAAGRVLVVNADDVGLHPGLTDGALASHDEGIVTSCSVVATGPDFAATSALLRARPALDVGVHLALTGGSPLSPAGEVASLVDDSGGLPRDWRVPVWRAATGRLRPDEVERELRRQVARVLDAGLAVSHLDGHQHLHVLPGVVEVVVAVAAELGIRFVRCPRESRPWRSGGGRAVALLGLDRLGRRAAQRVRAAGLQRPARTLGIARAGRLDGGELLRLVGGVEGVCELVCHPGFAQAGLEAALGAGYRWETELRALCDPALRAASTARGVRLASFRELVA